MQTHLMLVLLTPNDAFLRLSSADRLALMNKIAAPIQEWTGRDGGVCFSERFKSRPRDMIILGVLIGSAGLADAFDKALKSGDIGSYFTWEALGGDFFGISNLNDDSETQRVMARILQPFLEI